MAIVLTFFSAMKMSLSLLLALLTLSASVISAWLLSSDLAAFKQKKKQLLAELEQIDPRVEANVEILRLADKANSELPELPELFGTATANFDKAVDRRRKRPFDPKEFAIRGLPHLDWDHDRWLVHIPDGSQAWLEILASDEPKSDPRFISREHLASAQQTEKRLVFRKSLPGGVSEISFEKFDADAKPKAPNSDPQTGTFISINGVRIINTSDIFQSDPRPGSPAWETRLDPTKATHLEEFCKRQRVPIRTTLAAQSKKELEAQTLRFRIATWPKANDDR